ncbi:magnesium-translocating P-type ATPase [Candidatus Saccharibacteria bacterium]|nr:magnesium-translocating P-type ATPase [Candidatus Saccharibacteria bacterium]
MIQTGLTSKDAAARQQKYGRNEIVSNRRLPGVTAFLSRFKNPLVIILILAATLSAFVGDKVSFVIIIVIVIISITLDFVNTYRSEAAADALKDRVRVQSEILRDGVWVSLPLAEIVPGDIVKLAAGKIIPADGQVAEGKDLYANESSLTGESFPVAKGPSLDLYMGSSIISGGGTMLVTATGKSTKYAHVAAAISASSGPTEFDREISQFSLLIIKITTGLVIFIFAANVYFHRGFLEALLFSVALAVGLTPELLPLIITLNLTKGSLAMAKHGVIVKRLASIQNFGSMDVLCTDKTGTLTEDRITVVKYVDGYGGVNEHVLLNAYLGSIFTTRYESPLDRAVRNFRKLDVSAYTKLDEVPYDFERKRESVAVAQGAHATLITKGAPEEIMKICRTYHDGRPFSEVVKQVTSQYNALSADGFRVLAVASRALPKRDSYEPEDETKMVFEGFVAYLDPAKKSVRGTLNQMTEYGIEVKIVTGDNDLVTSRIAQEIDLTVKGILTGLQIERLNDLELREAAERTTIFARVSPEQKLRVIQSLQASGHVVGYMGDGINDAPALKAADIGISVNNAVDVAKDTADLILLHKSLHDLIAGVIEGRRTFANTLKYLMMSLGSNFGNMFSMAGGSLILPFLPMKATQILLTNLLYDTSQFALPIDNVDVESLKKPRKLNLRSLEKAMLVFGPLSSIFDFITFGALYWGFHLSESGFQTGWFLESAATQTLVVYIIRTRKLPFIGSRPSSWLVVSTLTTVAAAYIIALSPIGHFFGFSYISPEVIGVIVLIVATYLATTELVKQWFYRHVTL